MICSDTALAWLEVISAKGVAPAKWVPVSRSIPLREIIRLLEIAEGRERLSRRLGRSIGPPDEEFVEEQIERLRDGDYGLVSIHDESYPKLLREIDDPPPLLYFVGELAALAKPSICIVGSRRASRRGLINARSLAEELSSRGIHVVSGLARGIDGAAHEGACGGEGGTSAVLGCGVDIVYPPEHARLAEEILKKGCIVSEFPLGAAPFKHHFPQRNRILSGLSLGVVVVEAGLESGAMGTAAWALAQNREVFAVPGPIDYPGSRGPHSLIREGACLVEIADDILAELPSYAGGESRCAAAPRENAEAAFTDDERAVLSALDIEPKHIDELVQFCHISPALMLSLLLALEMRGAILSCGSGAYALAASRKGN